MSLLTGRTTAQKSTVAESVHFLLHIERRHGRRVAAELAEVAGLRSGSRQV